MKYLAYLENKYSSLNTIKSYYKAYQKYFSMYLKLSQRNINEYKKYLVTRYKVNTVNLYLSGLLQFIKYKNKHDKLNISLIKNTINESIDKFITIKDYNLICNLSNIYPRLIKSIFIIKLIALTGLRVSELIYIKWSDLKRGYADVLSKGDKIRRVYITEKLYNKYNGLKTSSDYIFLSSNNKLITTRTIRYKIKKIKLYIKVDEDLLHPHAFRHFFAHQFLNSSNDIALLSDILGHKSINTTKIYLRKSHSEKIKLVNQFVSW